MNPLASSLEFWKSWLSPVVWFQNYLSNAIRSLCPRLPGTILSGGLWAWLLNFQEFYFLVFLGLHSQHMEVPGLGVQSELQLPAYATATATPDLSCVCDLHHSSRQHQIVNPLIEAKDGTRILMDTSRVCYHWATARTPHYFNNNKKIQNYKSTKAINETRNSFA